MRMARIYLQGLLMGVVTIVLCMFVGMLTLYAERDPRLAHVHGVKDAVSLVLTKAEEAQDAWTHEYDDYGAPSTAGKQAHKQ